MLMPTAWKALRVNELRLLDDIHLVRDAMVRLRLHAVEFAIDDFGSLLRDPSAFRVPFSELNIDRRFVHGCASDPHKLAICKAAAQIARQMKVLSVAEGIESPADMQCVKELGFDLAQGNLFSPAVTLEELRKMHYAILYEEVAQPRVARMRAR